MIIVKNELFENDQQWGRWVNLLLLLLAITRESWIRNQPTTELELGAKEWILRFVASLRRFRSSEAFLLLEEAGD